MASSRRTLNVSLRDDSDFSHVGIQPNRKKKGKYFLFLLIPIIVFTVVLLTNADLLRSFKVALNELEVRYDTFSLSFSDTVPSDLKEGIQTELAKIEHNGKRRFSFEDEADINVGFVDEEFALFTDYLIPVGHFYWLENSIEVENLEKREIVVEQGNAAFVEAVLEKYLEVEVDVQEKDNVLAYLEDSEGSAISFVTLENLNHNYQIMNLDEKYFLDDLEGGIPFHIGVDQNFAPEFLVNIIAVNTQDLFEPFKLDDVTKINMSGVTAISRNLAFKIEESGNPAYPAELIANFLGDADIVHTSNEVSFVPNCIPESSMRFCSHPKYIETLEAINANVILWWWFECRGCSRNSF